MASLLDARSECGPPGDRPCSPNAWLPGVAVQFGRCGFAPDIPLDVDAPALPDMVVKMILDALDRQVDNTSTERDMLILAAASVKVLSPKQDIYSLNKLLEQGGRSILSCSNAVNFWASVRCAQIFKAFKVKPFEREVDEFGWSIEGSSYEGLGFRVYP